MERWADHFNSVFNLLTSINEDALVRLPQKESNVLLDEIPSNLETNAI